MKTHVETIDRTILELQSKAIDQIVEEIDQILDLVQEQQEAINMLERCVVALQRIALKERES